MDISSFDCSAVACWSRSVIKVPFFWITEFEPSTNSGYAVVDDFGNLVRVPS